MQTSTIQVYQDDAVWTKLAAQRRRWFQLPPDELDRLYVTTYTVQGETLDVADVRRHALDVRAMHPGCVLVHL